MTKNLCGPLIQWQLTKWPAIANRFFTPGINLRGLWLSPVTLSVHHLPRCLRSTVACGRTHTMV